MHSKKIMSFVVAGISLTGTLAFANSWKSENIQVEAENWKGEIEKWDTMNEQWFEKRDKYYDDNFKDFRRTKGEYCDGQGCFEESLFGVEYKSDTKSFKIKDGRFEVKLKDIDFSNSNGGQSFKFSNSATKEQWKSSNFGQSLEYTDTIGNEWESRNYGQSIEFNGVSGEKWKSSNFGQRLEFTDKNGKTWESSNFGQSVKNNGESVEFDIQDDLFNY